MRERMLKLAADYGFDAEFVPVSEFVFQPEYRKFCEQNLCGNYDKNYSCPPYCGSPEEMEAKVRKYTKGLILRKQTPVSSALNGEETLPLKKEHSRKTAELVRILKEEFGITDSLCIGAGPCTYCSKCLMQEGLPCPRIDERYSCVSAYCLDVSNLAQSAGMPLDWSLEQVTYFSLFCFS